MGTSHRDFWVFCKVWIPIYPHDILTKKQMKILPRNFFRQINEKSALVNNYPMQCGEVPKNAVTLKKFREINSLLTSLIKTFV